MGERLGHHATATQGAYAMLDHAAPADPAIHETAVHAAYRCRRVIQAVLREEEWHDADWEFYRIIREMLEEFVRNGTVTNGRRDAV